MKLSARSFFAACLFLFSACFLVSAQSAIKPSSGKAMCSALAPADFSKAGVPVSALSEANTDGTDGAYCVYKSTAGKVEFDIFYPAGANPAEVGATEKTVLGEGGGKFETIRLAGADDAHISLAMSGLPGSAGIVVRKGKAVFDIVIPKGAKARDQLLALARVVMGRIK